MRLLERGDDHFSIMEVFGSVGIAEFGIISGLLVNKLALYTTLYVLIIVPFAK